jgi:DegV family protein with EDD domain
MSKVAVVTDSTAGLPPHLVDQYNIVVEPQTLVLENVSYRDEIDITASEFYEKLEKAPVLPTTAQVTPSAFHSTFSTLTDSGQDVLAILVSEKMSGTLASAHQAKEMLPGRHIEVFDSQFAAMALGFVVLAAARAAADGASLEECVQVAEKARENTGVYFMVDNLKYLHMGGRIGSGARFLGTALNLKPILYVPAGKIEAFERVRTSRKAQDRLVEVFVAGIQDKQPVHLAVMHANAPDEAGELLQKALAKVTPVESFCLDLSPVVGSHTGPGTLVLAYMAGL